MRILDRYVLSNFLVPFLLCFFGFLGILLIFDLSDNGQDFLQAGVPLLKIGSFYLSLLPQMIVSCLPMGLLLALLYSLGRMSRSNEIISMLCAGQSLTRTLAPLIAIGVMTSLLSLGLNYKLAPRSEAVRKQRLADLMNKQAKDKSSEGQLFRNRADHRTWYVQKNKWKTNTLEGLHLIQQDSKGVILEKYYAKRACFNPEKKLWRLEEGKLVKFDADGNITGEELWLDASRDITHWPETPWRVASANLDPQHLTMPELLKYVELNSDFPPAQLAPYLTILQNRLAVPWSCLVVIFIAAPLGVVFSRRGVLAGVSSSVFIFFLMIFLTEFSLALGKGARISPVLAGWAPNLIFTLVGLYLLHLRSSNRELPSLQSLFKFR